MEVPGFRQRLAHRLQGHLLLQTLILDTAFFWAFVLVVLVMLGLGLGLPKMWRTTPKGFTRGTVRVSLLDHVQAWSLSRTATRAAAAGQYGQAILARRGALANNLGDPRLHRNLLVSLRDFPEAPPDHVILALFSGSWLLALSETNLTDLELVGDVLEKYRLPAYTLEFIATSGHEHDPALAPLRARCLLSAGRISEFASLWEIHGSRWSEDPRQKLYHDAWLAGWETGTRSFEAMLRLKEAAAEEGNRGLTAARLLLLAAPRRGGPDDVRLALARLEQGNAASVSQHAVLWRFLASLGHLEEARSAARGFQSRPRLAHEAAEYAAVLASLGLRDEALRFLEENLTRFEANPAVWEVYLSILIDARRWNDIRRASADIRTRTASFETARILALFAEYRAELGEGREHTADAVAARLADARIVDNNMALVIADTLTRDHRPSAALRLLQSKEADLHDEPRYWQAVFAAALQHRDVAALEKSTTALLRLAPNSPVALSNRAAMLLALEQDPAEALRITFRLVSEFPGSAPFLINHAFALLLNQRVDEAWAVLRQLDPSTLERQAASAYHLARTEALYARGEYQEALDAARQVQPGLILPPQAERLEKRRRELAQLTRSSRD